jgi:DNA polymerase III sliding clamp (beta) subunit (PCNA family)
MNLNRAALITALGLAAKVATAGRIPLLSHALLRHTPGRLELVATDLETTVILEIPFTGAALSTPTLAPIAWLLKLLKSMDGEEVVLDRNTVNAITMYEGAPGDPLPEDFPASPDPIRFTSVQIPGLTAAMKFAYDAASVDPSRFALNHVQVIASKKEVNVNATDGHRLYRQWLAPAGAILTKLIPASLLDVCGLKKLIPPDQFSYGKSGEDHVTAPEYIALRVEGQDITGWVIAREISGTFPHCDVVTPMDGSAVLQIALDPAPTMQVVKQAIALASIDRHAMLDLVVRGGQFLIHPLGCNTELPVPGANPMDSPDMIIGINGHYLRDALLNLAAPVITLRAKDPGSPIWFTEGRGKAKRTIVIMPMRTNYVGLKSIDGKPTAVESIA